MNRGKGELGRLFRLGTLTGLSDLQLLERFAAQREELAFEILMTRYAPMVLGVCRNVLRDPNDEPKEQVQPIVWITWGGMRSRSFSKSWIVCLSVIESRSCCVTCKG